MKISYKQINLSDGESTYLIGSGDMVTAVFLTGGEITLTKNININWAEGNNSAPIGTIVHIHKIASIIMSSYMVKLFGYDMPKDVAVYGDYIICVKATSTKWKITGLLGFNFLFGGGIEIVGGSGAHPTDGLVGFGSREIGVKVEDIVDNDTIRVVNDKIVSNTGGMSMVNLFDDFIGTTTRDLLNADYISEPGGIVRITADNRAGYEGNITDKDIMFTNAKKPVITIRSRVHLRGNSTIYIGTLDAPGTPTRGAYFKLSATNNEVFAVVNDGTERSITTGITLSVDTFYIFDIEIDQNGYTKFYINGNVVREENGYAVPNALYTAIVAVDSGSSSTELDTDYIGISMLR